MKYKAIEKLFNLAYTDSMTGVKNRNAFDEMREQMYKNGGNLDKLCAISVIFEDFDLISKVYGNSTCDDAIREIARCILEILGEKADIYRTAKNEFVCISCKSLFPYVVKLSNEMFKITEEKEYPFRPVISCSKFDKRTHKDIDDFFIYCDERATR